MAQVAKLHRRTGAREDAVKYTAAAAACFFLQGGECKTSVGGKPAFARNFFCTTLAWLAACFRRSASVAAPP